MPRSRSIGRLLERHKLVLSNALANSNVIQQLSNKGVITTLEEVQLSTEHNEETRGDLLVQIFSQKGFNALRELCITLELESPELQLTALLLDSADGVSDTNHSRENSNLSNNIMMSPSQKLDNRELEANRTPSNGSLAGMNPNSLNNGYDGIYDTDYKIKNIIYDNIHELLEEPVEEAISMTKRKTKSKRLKTGERIAWEFHHVQLSRVPGYGFGIAVSGGRDNPHFTNGDPSIAISDVLKAGPAEGRLLINDRVISANNISLEGVDYATAVQVLRDSGQTVNLVVKRRVVLPPVNNSPEINNDIRVSLTRNRKKEDFGVVLGCKIYVKDIIRKSPADKDPNIHEGDFILKINNTSIDGLNLKEARKLLDASKERLELVLQQKETNKKPTKSSKNSRDELLNVLPSNTVTTNEKVNNINGHLPYEVTERDPTPPRPPLPNDDAHSNSTVPTNDNDLNKQNGSVQHQVEQEPEYVSRKDSYGTSQKGILPDPRFISFKKTGSVGIRLTGGNEVGIFVTAVQPGSPAAQQGLQPGDKIIKVNDMDMKGVTREEAVLFLLSLQDQIDLIAQYRRDEYDQIVSLQRGDSFYIKAHFNYDNPENNEMAFRKSDVFHVVDTLHNGGVGSWQVFRMDPFLSGIGSSAEQVKKGVIPNKSRAEEIATQQFNAAKKEQTLTENTKTSFFRRRREKSRARSKSLGKDHWEDLVWSESMSKFPAYERVSLKHPGFPRPVVIFGPIADVARENLLRDFPAKFSSPQQESGSNGQTKTKSGIVRLSSIRTIMDRSNHALLDVTPSAVDKLNYAQFYPIVIFARTDSKQTIKECRSGLPKNVLLASASRKDWLTTIRKAHLSSKKLLEQCQKLQKLWNHIFTVSLDLTSDNWYNKLVDLIDKQQSAPIWMSETKPGENFSDDFLFPMSSSRLSYTSSPESDGEFCDPETPSASRTQLTNIGKMDSIGPGNSNTLNANMQLMSRSTSDPSLVQQMANNSNGNRADETRIPDYSAPPPYAIAPSMSNDTYQGGSPSKDSKYGFTGGRKNHHQRYPSTNDSIDDLPLPPPPPVQVEEGSKKSSPQSQVAYNSNSDAPPPKIDRQKKPSRRSGNYSHHKNGGDMSYGEKIRSLERSAHMRENKMGVYDNGNSVYDAYNSRDGVDGTPPHHQNRNSRNLSQYGSFVDNQVNQGSNSNRNSRALSQESGYRTGKSVSMPYGYPNSMPADPNSANIDNFRHMDYKPVPPPKSSLYKPIPPPKPKTYPRTQGHPMSHMEGNYMNSGPNTNGNHQHHHEYMSYQGTPQTTGYNQYSSTTPNAKATMNYHQSTPNGRFENDSNGFDSGQGSSLDRDFNNRNNDSTNQPRYSNPPPGSINRSQGQYYYNLPHNARNENHGPKKIVGDGLDLSNREYRGSAFELYKKPMSLQQNNYNSMDPNPQL